MEIGFKLFAIFLFVLVAFAQNKNDQHLLFTQILNDYVHNGLVNYIKLKDDKRLDKYLVQLENTNPDNLLTAPAARRSSTRFCVSWSTSSTSRWGSKTR